MVAKRLCTFDQVSWHSWIPGRLQQIRLHLKGRALDILNCYQFVRHPDKFRDRTQFWQSLHDALSQIPNRNILLLAGDMNTSLTTANASVGVASYLWQSRRTCGPKARDQSTFKNLLQQYNLVTLNTWTSSDGPTFCNDTASSRIDFICTRRVHADGLAKQACTVPQMPLVPQTGPRHFPIMTTLKKHWFTTPKKTSTAWTPVQRHCLRQHWLQNDDTWTAVNETVARHLDHVYENSSPPSLNELHATLNDKVHPMVATSSHRPRQETHLNGFHLFLSCRQKLQTITCRSLAMIFQSWNLVTLQHKARLQIRQHSELQRKAKRQHLMQTARSAADAKDQYTLFAHIRRITPKVPKVNIRLRGTDGQLLGPDEAAQMIADWLQHLYSDPTNTDHTSQAYSWPLDVADLHHGFHQFEINKALDPEFLPSIFWKHHANAVSCMIHDLAQQWCRQAPHFAPDLWSRGTLCFLSKPNKKTDHPDALRPIALLEPTGKAIMGALAKQLMAVMWDRLCTIPQFAYMNGRGSSEAIGRVLNMIDLVMNNVAAYQYKHHPIAHHAARTGAWGGLIVSLDLSKAFVLIVNAYFKL